VETLKSNNDFMVKEDLFSRVILPALCVIATNLSEPFWWMLSIGFLMACDFGIRITTLKKGEFDSKKMWASVNKFGRGLIFISVAFFVQKTIVPDIPLLKIVGGLMVASELKSIDEKAKEIYGFSLFDFVIHRLTNKKNNNNGE
jgi:hypothetical protein